MEKRKGGLGKGLGSLIPDAIKEPTVQQVVVSAIQELPLADIRPNPHQPRKEFDEETLEELAASIKSIGIVQPITVREVEDGKYEIVAGERRYRASKMAGRETIPAYIRKTENDDVLALALIENIQRDDLNAMEVAISYQRLIDECNLTQEGLSERVGKKRATIANYLRLLKLPAEVQLGIKNKQIDMGHARALASLDDAAAMIGIYEEASKNGYSVRQVEEMVHSALNGGNPAKSKQNQENKDKNADFEPLCGKLSQVLGAKVSISRNAKGKGKISLQFSSDEELENLLAILDKIH